MWSLSVRRLNSYVDGSLIQRPRYYIDIRFTDTIHIMYVESTPLVDQATKLMQVRAMLCGKKHMQKRRRQTDCDGRCSISLSDWQRIPGNSGTVQKCSHQQVLRAEEIGVVYKATTHWNGCVLASFPLGRCHNILHLSLLKDCLPPIEQFATKYRLGPPLCYHSDESHRCHWSQLPSSLLVPTTSLRGCGYELRFIIELPAVATA